MACSIVVVLMILVCYSLFLILKNLLQILDTVSGLVPELDTIPNIDGIWKSTKHHLRSVILINTNDLKIDLTPTRTSPPIGSLLFISKIFKVDSEISDKIPSLGGRKYR